MNSAITANNNFLPSPRGHTREHFPEALIKITDGQYSSVELEQAKLASDSLYCTWTEPF